MDRFEVLRGLPPYGPLAESLAGPHDRRTYREGFVVRFTSSRGECWTGNFQPGNGSLNSAIEHPNGRQVIVISGGQGYVVAPNDRSQRVYFGGWIHQVVSVPELQLVIFTDSWGFEAIGPAGLVWRSETPFYGIQNLRQEDLMVRGEGWHPPDQRWVRFDLDVGSGSLVLGDCVE